MLINKDDRKLVNVARMESRAIADATAGVDINGKDLLSSGYDFNAWANSLTDEEIFEKIPRLTKRLDYLCLLAVDVQKDAADTIREIYAMRETLKMLATRKANREEETKCQKN